MVKGFKLLRIIFVVLFCMLSISLFAKEGITIYGTYTVNGGATSGVQIRLLRNGINETNNRSGNGKFEYDLQFNNQYELSFSKAGYITKKVVISTDVPERVLKSNSNFPPFKIEIELFRAVEGGDYAIFDEAVALVIYDKELDDFDFDRAYNAEVEEQIKDVEAQIVKAAVVPKIDESSRLYEELIKKADGEFEAKSYVNARKTYQKALKVKPQEKYPPIRIELIDKILADLAKRKKQKEQNDAYYALIDKADILFEEKTYQEARSYYVEASELKPDQQYPKDKIKLIDQIFAQGEAAQRDYDNAVALGDRYFQEKNYEPARTSYEKALAMRKDEPYPKEQIKRIERLLAELKSEKEREHSYKEAIARADRLFQAKNWFDARDTYEQAADLLPSKRYPKDKIAEIDKILKAEKTTLQQYTEALNRADAYFGKEQWSNAQHHYEKALTVRPEEVYPKEQLKKISDILAGIVAQSNRDKAYQQAIIKGDKTFAAEMWAESKEAYFNALKAKPEEAYPKERIKIIEEKVAELAAQKAEENRYNEKLKQADWHYDQKEWDDALAQYKAALEMKPSEHYPKAQIQKIERFLKEELERKTVQEREDTYNAFIAEGDRAYEVENWEKALASYEGALQIKPTASYPRNRINAINQRLKELAQEEKLQKLYAAAIAEADSLFGVSQWLPAIAMYEKALDSKPQEAYPKAQIEKIQARLTAEELAREEARKASEREELRKAYEKAIAMADRELADKRYGFAKQGYRKALSILPEEQYPKEKLAEIAALFQQQEEAKNQYYKVLSIKDTIAHRYYKRIVPEEQSEQRFVKVIDATQADEAKYEAFMQKAQQEEAAGNIPFAKAYYRQAYLEKPSAQLLAKLKELESLTTQVSETTE